MIGWFVLQTLRLGDVCPGVAWASLKYTWILKLLQAHRTPAAISLTAHHSAFLLGPHVVLSFRQPAPSGLCTLSPQSHSLHQQPDTEVTHRFFVPLFLYDAFLWCVLISSGSSRNNWLLFFILLIDTTNLTMSKKTELYFLVLFSLSLWILFSLWRFIFHNVDCLQRASLTSSFIS